MSEIVVVIPMYNERQRLQLPTFATYLQEHPNVAFLFVDDGSQDGTADFVQDFVEKHTGRCSLLRLNKNCGKAEAVRRGLLQALDRRPKLVGFWDADLATPLSAIAEMAAVFSTRPALRLVMAARVKLLGRNIRRHAHRHYLGRVFATVVSWLLDLPVYDTQCGAKIFRANAELAALLSAPFLSRWIFDVEIIARLDASVALAAAIYEFPLEQWEDVAGSKLRTKDYVRALLELSRLYLTYKVPKLEKSYPHPASEPPARWFGWAEALLAICLMALFAAVLSNTGTSLAAKSHRMSFDKSFFEIENLKTENKSPELVLAQQDTKPFGAGLWSGNSQLFVRGGQVGDELQWFIPVSQAGKYSVRTYLTRSWDYGILAFTIGDKTDAAKTVDLFSTNGLVEPTGAIDLGSFDLTPPGITLTARITGHNAKAMAPFYQFGIDGIAIERR